MSDSTKEPGQSVTHLSPATIALVAVLITLTMVFTLSVRVPTPARGYANLSDVAITFASLAFGPWIGMVAGGVGTALADTLGGFVPFAPLSLVAHGLEGLMIGLLGWRRRTLPWMIAAWLVGALVMVTVYLVGETFFYRFLVPDAAELSLSAGWFFALAEVPLNIFQALVGGLAGIPLVLAVRKAYPPIERLGRRQSWTED